MMPRAKGVLQTFLVTLALGGAACGSDPPPAAPVPVPGCPTGFRDCDGDPGTVCETTADDPAHCGACGVVCPGGGPRQVPECVHDTCGLACEAGFADCNGGGEDGCETETDSNSMSCGSCTVTCAKDQACKFGSCRPAPFAVVANLPNKPWPIAVDDAFVYWGLRGSASAGAVQRAPKEGGSVTTLVGAQAEVHALAIDEVDVYWMSGTTVRKASKSSVMGTATELAGGFEIGEYPCLAVDEQFVYWCARDDVLRLPKDGSATDATVLATFPPSPNGAVAGLAVDSSHLYIAQIDAGPSGPGAIWRVDKAAPEPLPPLEPLATRQFGPVGVATDDTSVYWCNGDSIGWRKKDLSNKVSVLAAAPALVELPLYVAADGLTVHFTSESISGSGPGSLVQSVRVDATQLTTIASEPNSPGFITVDASYAYWTTSGTEDNGIWSGGAVYRIEK